MNIIHRLTICLTPGCNSKTDVCSLGNGFSIIECGGNCRSYRSREKTWYISVTQEKIFTFKFHPFYISILNNPTKEHRIRSGNEINVIFRGIELLEGVSLKEKILLNAEKLKTMDALLR